MSLFLCGTASAQAASDARGKINWGIWIDDDGCMHWWADGGVEGYMLDRVDPKTGRAICLKRDTCLMESTDSLFEGATATLTQDAKARLESFFAQTDAIGYAIYSDTDSRGAASANMALSADRAEAVAEAARAAGRTIDRAVGRGEQNPIATNSTAEGRQTNRRVEVVCYR